MEIVDAVGPCWTWTKTTYHNGYGKIWDRSRKRNVLLHRYVWEQRYGPAGKNMVIHHRCANRRCYNPSHLQRMSKFAHQYLESPIIRSNVQKTHCAHGHEFSKQNTYHGRGNSRLCKECITTWNRNHRHDAIM